METENLIKQVGTNFQTWSDQMTELFRAIDGAVSTLQESWESVASDSFRSMVEEATPHLTNLAEFMGTNSQGLISYGDDLNYMANTYYVTAG